VLGHPIGSELYGKHLGIIGLGNSGIELAKRAHSMEMKILALKRTPTEELISKYNLEFLGGPEDLNYVLKESDYVSLHTPLTEATRGFISTTEFKQMKSSAFLINVSRGPVIDRNALLVALKEKLIAGVGLDVYWEEPANPDDPIYQFENVITLPHIGGSSVESQIRMTETVVSNIIRISEEKKPINIQN
jgi:phosphoglycerate dehydrogenase-like enzyme